MNVYTVWISIPYRYIAFNSWSCTGFRLLSINFRNRLYSIPSENEYIYLACNGWKKMSAAFTHQPKQHLAMGDYDNHPP